MENEKQRILACMADVLKENNFRCEIAEGTDTMPAILRIETQKNGKVMQDVLIELCFIAIPLPRETGALLQFYATIFNGLPETHLKELKKACDWCNDFCALGYFSVFDSAGQLYIKHNVLLDTADPLEKNVNIIADNFSLILASIGRFVDALAAIANGVTTVELAHEQELLP